MDPTSYQLIFFYYKNRSSRRLIKHVFNLKGIFVNGTMKPAGSRAVVARTMAGMMEEVTDGGSSCRVHIFRRVPRAAATCLISARVELPSLHPPPHGLPLAAAAARPGPAASTTLRSLPRPQEMKAQGRVGKLSFQWSRQTRAPCQPTATPLLVVFRRLSGGD